MSFFFSKIFEVSSSATVPSGYTLLNYDTFFGLVLFYLNGIAEPKIAVPPITGESVDAVAAQMKAGAPFIKGSTPSGTTQGFMMPVIILVGVLGVLYFVSKRKSHRT